MTKNTIVILVLVMAWACSTDRNKESQTAIIPPQDFNFMEMIQPVSDQSKLEHEDWFTWGASVQKGDDGKFHMVYCRWPKKYPFSDGWLIDAELCYAVSENQAGPFTHVKTILTGVRAEGSNKGWDNASVYNPHLKKFKGKYHLYYTGTHDPYANGHSTDRAVLVRHQRIGVISFDTFENLLSGNFVRSQEPLLAPLSNYGYNVPEHEHFGDENNITAANIVVVNPSVEERPDGKYILVFKGWQNKKGFGPVHGVAVSGSPTGPFEVQPEPIMIVEQAGGEIAMAEDPFIWFNKSRNSFYALVRDFNGDITGRGHSMALFKSPDGIQWLPAENVLASDLRVRWEDGTKSQVARLERPQLLLDEDGEPQVLFAACAIESPSKKNGHSFNVHIPLKNRDNRVSIDLNKTRDNITVLMAASAKLSDGLQVKWPDKTPKHFWVEDFDDINEYLEWNVFVDKISEFHVDVLLSSKEGEQFELKVLNTNSVLPVAANGNGWDKIDAGLIRLEKGNNRLRLSKKSNRSSASIKSLELLEKKEHESYLKRVAKFKVDTDWLANSGYGLMLQFGAWTYPEKGEHRKSLDELASTFDMTAFVDLVKETGASYVVWSLTWWDYKMMMPVESVDRIIGNSKRTSSENFIGKLAQELKNNNIRFILYYHLGHASHLGGKTDWWQAQDWPEEFASTGTGQREVFFTNWMDVVSEIGESLGENLDGWFFDDGLVYYPAPFEKMGVAARNGNSGRLISYNPWVCARYTDFQDVSFGEGSHGEVKEGSAPAFGNGIFTSGPQKGLLQHAMFTMEGDWGVHSPNQKIETKITKEQAFKWYKSASERKVPLSFNIMMWEDGTVSQTSSEILKALKKEFRNK